MCVFQLLNPNGTAYTRENFDTLEELYFLVTQTYADLLSRDGFSFEIIY